MTQQYEHDAYAAFQEGSRLLAADNAHAAAIALEHARALEPDKGSVREALARAYFRSGRFDAAEREFLAALDIEPVNDYAHYGVGLCRLRAGPGPGPERGPKPRAPSGSRVGCRSGRRPAAARLERTWSRP